jgi:hypothetical protein
VSVLGKKKKFSGGHQQYLGVKLIPTIPLRTISGRDGRTTPIQNVVELVTFYKDQPILFERLGLILRITQPGLWNQLRNAGIHPTCPILGAGLPLRNPRKNASVDAIGPLSPKLRKALGGYLSKPPRHQPVWTNSLGAQLYSTSVKMLEAMRAFNFAKSISTRVGKTPPNPKSWKFIEEDSEANDKLGIAAAVRTAS